MSEQTHIRQLALEDAAHYRTLRLEALQLSPETFGSTFEQESTRSLDTFAQTLTRNTAFGAVNETALVGIAGYYVQQGPKVAHKGVLWGMYIQPDVRKSGLGRRLDEAVIDHARKNVELLQLTVVKENTTARKLYQSLGFVEYGIEKQALKHNGQYSDEVLMVKPLR